MLTFGLFCLTAVMQVGWMASAGLPRILILVNAFERDAPTRLMFEVAKAARASGRFAVHMAALSRGGPLQPEVADTLGGADCAPVLELGGARHFLSPARLRKVLIAGEYAIVHPSLLRPSLWVGRLARTLPGCKVMFTCHGTHEWSEAPPVPESLVRSAYVRAANSADAVVAVSGATQRELLAAGVKDERTRVIPNGVDTKRFRPRTYAEIRQDELPQIRPLVRPEPGDVESGGAPFIIGAAGNLIPIKGYDELLQAAAALQHDRVQFHFSLWGDGPEAINLHCRADDDNQNLPFRLEGSVPDLAPLLPQCDVFVQPSRREAFGLAAAEAMACGVPVVARRVGGLPELVGEGEQAGGMLFSSVSELVEQLRTLAANAELRRNLGFAAWKRVEEHFTIEHMTGDYLRLYDKLLSRGALAS